MGNHEPQPSPSGYAATIKVPLVGMIKAEKAQSQPRRLLGSHLSLAPSAIQSLTRANQSPHNSLRRSYEL